MASSLMVSGAPQTDESLGARWRRRAVTLPALLLVTGLATVLYVPSLPVLAVVDAFRRDRGAVVRAATLLVVFAWCEVLGVTAAFGIWLVSGQWLGRRRGRGSFLAANSRLQAIWGYALYRAGCWLFGLRVIVDGDVPDAREGPLLIAMRHASTLDTVIPVALLAYPLRYRMRYLMKRELLADPCLDIVGNRLPNRFVRRHGGQTEIEVARTVALYEGMGAGDALVIFPEGTRFSPGKRAAAIERLRQQGPSEALALAESLTRTLSPLKQGMLALLAENPGADLVVIAHTGLEPAGSFKTLASGALVGNTVRVRFVRVPFERIPTSADGQARMLTELWRAVDRFVGDGDSSAIPEAHFVGLSA